MYNKNYIIATIIITVSLFATNVFAESEYPLVDELFAISEDQIDIGLAALKLAKEIYPEMDIQAYSKKIDGLALGVKLITNYQTDPDIRIRALNTFLYKYYKLEYDLHDPNVEKLINRFIKGVIDRRKGSCVSMPLLYLAVAQRLGYPVYPVALPSHLMLRYVDPAMKLQNIEATSGGGYVSDGEYQYILKISDLGIKSGSYLRTMTYREFLGDLIADNGIYWSMQGDLERGIYYLHKAIEMNPRFADHYMTLGRTYAALSQEIPEPIISHEYRMLADACGGTRLCLAR